ncbi:MAG: hypothetical protein M0Z28_31420 [Rhodospirillales bacterium]|nr:hypothetical protein [Rhodospirillales bacterium]
MMRRIGSVAVMLLLLAAPVWAQNVEQAPPPAPYKKVSTLVKLPDFLPGLGTLYVDPGTLPAGPFLAYDHKGKLVSTIYMIPIKDITEQKTFADLASPGGRVDHVSLYFNAGHPGVPVPHYHIVLWHVSKQQESLVAK